MKYKFSVLFFLLVLISGVSRSQISYRIVLEWESPAGLVMGYDSSVLAPSFIGAQYLHLPENILPSFSRKLNLPDQAISVTADISDVKYIEFTDAELQLIQVTELPETPEPKVVLMREKGKPRAVFNMLPFGIDPANGKLAKIVSFTLSINYQSGDLELKSQHEYASNSVLSIGDWYKIYISESGIYKLTYDNLRDLGVSMNGLNPDLIRIYGNGGALLNESAGTARIDDLAENAIKVVTATPGVFDRGDYILFYGKGTRQWNMNPFTGRMEHITHFYADDACYFLTVGPEPGKRIQQDNTPEGEANYYSVSYTDFVVYENDNLNLIKSGRKWFGEKLDYYNYMVNLPVYQFPDMILDEPVSVRYGFAGRSSSQLSYNIIINDEIVATNTMAGITGSNDFARELTTSATFTSLSNTLNVKVKFNPPNNTALGWLDFVALNVRNNLRFSGGQMAFRDPRSVGPDKITSFTMNNAVNNLELWDVSEFTDVKSVPMTKTGDQYLFKRTTDKLTELVAFDGTSFLTPTLGEKIANQNLHATGNYDMILITHPEFAEQAQRLAMLHNNKGDVSVTVVSLPEIYNEFSSGIQDITAIRDFMKMLYDRGMETAQPQYMLLFGNASYDVKDRISNNLCFIPTFQSDNSVRPVASFLTDDYYGLLDEGEGANQTTGLVDVASGRLPVRTQDQANIVVNKIEYYLNNPEPTHGDWRNTVIVVADDQNKNLHLDQADGLTDEIEENYPVYNIEKIYFDAYKQISTPGGSRYPDVNREIVTRVEKGALITNYVGHGGEVGWADERVLEISDILSWTNYDRMGIFFTATCEFSRFDDPSLTSAGELVFLNPNGGAMSLITTTRLAFASYNAALNLSFIDTVLSSTDGVFPRLGDILRYTKNDNQISANNRHITLFGDPSLHLPYPEHKVVTTYISADTLFANSVATVEGEIHDYNDQLLTDFNGVLNVKVYDKPSKVRTLGQDNDSYPVDFMVQKSILYQGKVSVNSGEFSFTFPVPRDIDYSFGKGKISYYASDGVEDAHGFYNEITIGGSVSTPDNDLAGPDIRLYVNDTLFQDGDYTNENPKLIAYLDDESGINTAGNGIGHDIVATIDGDSYNSVLLNDYYVSDLDSYQSGTVRYQYFNLPDGEHTLTLKAWDVYNNSSSASITFNVKRNIVLAVNEVKAFPNPSAGDIWFSFGHNQFDGVFTADLEIYSLNGGLVRTVGPLTIASEGYVSGSIRWDGCLAGGQPARNGLYVCRLRVRDRNNNTTSNTVKVLLAK
ncbi:MAG: type IX secretion system sortase PorU [Bacteroidales bacterium]|nr:type IX secretion system sortase PorU [Bacteroidales bacterium]